MIDYEKLYGAAYFRNYGLGVGGDHSQYLSRVAMYGQEIARVSRHVKSGVVLDIGCGTGEFLAQFDSKIWTRFGVEPVSCARVAASELGIRFDIEKIQPETVDLVVYRGTFQHLDEPLRSIKQSIELLRPGGFMVFLATPNAGSLCYRIFQDLPALDPSRNFCILSSKTLCQILKNFGMEVEDVYYPYLGTPYAKPVMDHLKFIARIMGVKTKFAFWGNMLEIYARKPV